MPSRRWLAVLSIWPGLPQIWAGREFLGLVLAIGFAILLNAALLLTFIWTDLAGPAVASLAWYTGAAVWLSAAGVTSWWLWKYHPARFQAEIDRLLREALRHYLQGQWEQAQGRLQRVVRLDDRDCDALVHLGTLYARTGRTAEARQTFRRCLELEGGLRWQWEIADQLRRIEQN